MSTNTPAAALRLTSSPFRSYSALRKSLVLFPAFALAIAGNASAQTVTWDASGSHPTAPTDGSGTWTTGTGANWSTGSADTTFATGYSAVVGAGNGAAGTIGIATAGVSALSLTLNAAGSGNYTFGTTGALGNITLTSATNALTVNSSATFASNLLLNNAASTMSFATSGQTITLNGSGANSVGATITGTNTAISAASALALSGSGTYSGSGASSQVNVNIGNVTVASIGTNPGLTAPTTGVIVNTGATFSTGSTTTVGYANAAIGNGLVTVNGGTWSNGSYIVIGQSQALTNAARVVLDAGTITTNQLLMDYNTNTGGNDELDINGGAFTAGGTVSMQSWSETGGQSVISITGGTLSAPGIYLNGNGATGSQATGGSSTVNLSGTGTLYLGSSGIVNRGLGSSTYALNLSGGTLGATANWGSGLNMTLANTTTLQAANSTAVAENIVLSGALTGTGGLAKTGSGTATLSGANNYSGTTTVSAGTLQFTSEASLYNDTPASWTAANITVANGATLSLNVGGSGQFTTGDVSTLLTNLDGAVSSDGLEAGSTIAFDTTNASSPFTIANAIANTTGTSGGAVALTKLGSGTVALTGTNTYTGATTVNGGTLDLGGGGATGAISSGSALVLGGGALNYTVTGTNSQTFASLTLNAGASSVSTTATDTIALGAITRNAGSTVNFVNNTTGSLTTTATNDTNGILGGYATFNGTDWAVNNGSNVIAALGTYETTTAGGTTTANYTNKNTDVTSTLSLGATTPNTLRFNTNTGSAGETLTLTGTAALVDGGILVTPNAGAFTSTITGSTLEGSASGNLIVIQNDTSGSLNIASIIANHTGATGLIKSGSGTLSLSGANTYTGVTYLDAGVVTLNNANSLNTAALSGGIAFDGGTMQYGSATTDYSSAIKNSSNAITVDLNGDAVTWASALAASNTGGLTVLDSSAGHAGNLTLSAAGAFGGNLTIKSGEVTLATAGAAGVGSIILGDAANTGLAATLQTTASAGDSNPITVTGNGTDTIYNNGTSSVNFSGAVALNNNLTVTDIGASGSTTLAGAITGTGSLTVNGAGATNISGVIGAGVGGVTVNGTGTTLTLSGANTFTTGLTIINGTVTLNSANAAGAGAITLGGGGTATLLAGPVNIANNITLGSTTGTLTIGNTTTATSTFSGGINLNGSNLSILETAGATGTVTVTGGVTGTGNLTLLGNATAGPITLSGTTINNVGTITNAGTSSAAANISAAIGPNVSNVTENSSGSVLTLSGNNSNFTGTVTVTTGTLKMGGASALDANNVVSVASAGTFDINNQNETIGGLGTGTGSVTNSGNAVHTLTIGGSGNNSFGGAITAATVTNLALTMAGTGTQTLSGTSTYTGATTVNSGTLEIGNGTSGSIASGSGLTMGGGTFYLDGKTGSATSQTVASLATTASTASAITLNPNGNLTTLTITSATLSTGAGSSLNFNLTLGTTNATTSTLGNTVVAWNPALTNGIINAAYTVTDSGGAGYATVKSGDVVRYTDPGSDGLPVNTGASTGNYFVDQNYSKTSTSTAGSLVEALSGNVLANTVTIDTTGLTSGANLSLGAHSLTTTAGGGYLFTGANPYAITASSGGGLTSSGAIIFNNYDSSAVTISAPILSTTTATFNGTGTTILSGSNTYTGATTINGGTLQLGGGSTTGSLATGSAISGTAGTFAIDRSDSVTQGTQFTGTAISGAIGLIQMGSGTTTLNAANTYTGGTVVQAGTLIAGISSTGSITNGAFGTGVVTLGNGSTSNASVTLLDAGFTVANPITVSSNSTSGGYTIGGSNVTGTSTYSGAITLNQAVTLQSATNGTTDFSTSGTWVTNNNAFTIGSAGNTGTVKIDDLITSTTTGTTITVTNGSALNLTNTSNTFLGGVAVNSGSASFSTGNSSATGAQSLGENASLTLGLAGGSPTSGTLIYTGSNTAGSSAATLNKSITVAVGTTGTISNTGGSTLTLSGTLTKANSTLTLTGGVFDVTGQITGGNTSTFNSDLVVNGAATVTLDGSSNNYTGPTDVYGGSTLKDGAGTMPSGTVLTLGNSSDGAVTNIFDLNGDSQSVAALDSISNSGNTNVNEVTNGATGTGTGTLTLTGENSDWVSGPANSSSTFGGVIQDGATAHTALAITGGTHTLTGNSTYSGGTAISGGTLYVNNTGGASYTQPISNPHAAITATNSTGSGTGTGSVMVSSGGTLAGSGTIASSTGGISVQSGGTLSSGAIQSGTTAGQGLTINNAANLSNALVVNGGATLSFDLGSSTPWNGGSGALDFSNPNTNSTYLSLTGSTVDQIFSNTTTADNINLVDLTNGSLAVSLTLRSQNPYLLIQTSLGNDADFANLVTTGGTGANGYVLGVSNGSGGYTAFILTAYDVNGNQINTSSNLQNLRLYLYNGDLEVVPEPGTWALMVGGLALLILIQRRKNKLG